MIELEPASNGRPRCLREILTNHQNMRLELGDADVNTAQDMKLGPGVDFEGF